MKRILVGALVLPFLFIAACGKGKEGASVKQKPETPAVSVPATPMGISTLAGDSQVVLRWGAVAGADSYNVYFSDKEGQPADKATIAPGVKETSYEHKALKNGSIYYYRVSAENKAGESPVSGETGAMPKAVAPSVPSGVAAVGGTGAVTVKWAPVQGATSYNVYFSTKPQVVKSLRTKISGIKQPPYEHKDVKKKTMYFYVVSAVNDSGEGPASGESGAMP